MKHPTATPPTDEGFCLIRNDCFFRIQRKLGLIPETGLGIGRRALFWSMLAWLPLVIWSAVTGHLVASDGQTESLLQHFGVHVRALVAIPLFILAEGLSHRTTHRLLPYFPDSGLISERDIPKYRQIVLDLKRLRDSSLPWVGIVGLLLARLTLPLASGEMHELSWADTTTGQAMAQYGFGGWWFLYVTRTIFLVLCLAWFWRLALLGILLSRIARLDLAIVPTHPDGVGGLGFLQQMPKAFAPVVFALSSVTAAKWAHDAAYHAQSVIELKILMIGFVVLVLGIFLLPYLVFSGILITAKHEALLDYGKLVGVHGRLVRRRWVLQESIGEQTLLDAPELGPVADTAAIYAAVAAMRTTPVGKKAVLSLALPLLIPMLVLLSLQVPIKQILLTLLKTLA